MRDILTITMIGLLGAGLVGCSKSDPAATKLCNDYAATTCQQFFTCGADDLAAAAAGAADAGAGAGTPPWNLACTPKLPLKPSYFPQRFACYTSVDDCTAKERAKTCSDVADNRCDQGATYHADNAQACLSAWQALTCDEIKNFAGQPLVCEQICTLPQTNAGPPL
jgi:hypothetical protein